MTGGRPAGNAAEDQLRDVFDALTTSVHGSPSHYPKALAQWRRRERRRRLLVAILAAIVFAVADIIGLWALGKAGVGTHIIFNDRPGITQTPRGGIGPPP
jgi:hypothetical protein